MMTREEAERFKNENRNVVTNNYIRPMDNTVWKVIDLSVKSKNELTNDWQVMCLLKLISSDHPVAIPSYSEDLEIIRKIFKPA